MGQLNFEQPGFKSESGYLPPTHKGRGKGLLQRKCACGNHSGGGECEACSKNKLQRKLSIGASNDPLEQEADRVADQVVNGSAEYNFQSAKPSIQRAPGGDFGAANEAEQDDVPDSVEQTLADSGRPMATPLRRDMERRFGRDFSQVRLHTGTLAERSTQEVDARAYTMGNDVVFGQSNFAPHTRSGQQLLAHELTHVVQQGGGGSQIMRAPNNPGKTSKAKDAKSKEAKPKDSKVADNKAKDAKQKKKPDKPKTPQIYGRDSRKVKDNFITKVSLDVGAHTLKITWDDPATEPALSKGTHKISPGTGKCCKDCDNEKTSQTVGSLCTPKGDDWLVTGTARTLGGHPTAKNPTYFQRAGVAIHSGNLSSAPASHGCARTSLNISELIHDNVKTGITKIASSGTWKGSRCFMKEPDKTSVERSKVCDDFKLKPPPKKAKPKKDTPKKDAPDTDQKKGAIKKGTTKKGKATPQGKQTSIPDAMPPVATLPSITDLPDVNEPLFTDDPSLGEVDEFAPDGPGPDNATADTSAPSEELLDDVALESAPEPEDEIV